MRVLLLVLVSFPQCFASDPSADQDHGGYLGSALTATLAVAGRAYKLLAASAETVHRPSRRDSAMQDPQWHAFRAAMLPVNTANTTFTDGSGVCARPDPPYCDNCPDRFDAWRSSSWKPRPDCRRVCVQLSQYLQCFADSGHDTRSVLSQCKSQSTRCERCSETNFRCSISCEGVGDGRYDPECRDATDPVFWISVVFVLLSFVLIPCGLVTLLVGVPVLVYAILACPCMFRDMLRNNASSRNGTPTTSTIEARGRMERGLPAVSRFTLL